MWRRNLCLMHVFNATQKLIANKHFFYHTDFNQKGKRLTSKDPGSNTGTVESVSFFTERFQIL